MAESRGSAPRVAIEHTGTLTKRGRFNKTWKVRSFTLYRLGWLVYFEKSSNPQKGRVLVAHCDVAVDETFGRPFTFTITSADGDALVLQAIDEADRDSWMRCVKAGSLSGALCQVLQ